MKKLRLNIGSPKGNAFYILGLVGTLESDKDKAEKIRTKMKSDNYDNLLKVFKEYFPGVTLYSNTELNGVDSNLYEINDFDAREL